METTETPEQTLPEQPKRELILGDEAKYYLHTIGRWANCVSGVGLIVTALILLLVIFVGSLFSMMSNLQQQYTVGGGAFAYNAMNAGLNFLRFLYLGIAVFHFFAAFYLNKFATKIKQGVALNNANTATSAFENLKSFFKLIGIATIVVLSIYILMIVFFLVVFAASRR